MRCDASPAIRRTQALLPKPHCSEQPSDDSCRQSGSRTLSPRANVKSGTRPVITFDEVRTDEQTQAVSFNDSEIRRCAPRSNPRIPATLGFEDVDEQRPGTQIH